jgi:hypothetical protein
MLEITCHNVLCYRLVWLTKSEEGWYLVQIFPAYVKGVAGSVATLVNWFSAYIVTMIFNYMLLWSAAGTETWRLLPFLLNFFLLMDRFFVYSCQEIV